MGYVLMKSREAIRMNILCNPTGKDGSFRAIDWVVELNNLFTKVSEDRVHEINELTGKCST